MKILYSTRIVNHLPATCFASFLSDLLSSEHRTTTALQSGQGGFLDVQSFPEFAYSLFSTA